MPETVWAKLGMNWIIQIHKQARDYGLGLPGYNSGLVCSEKFRISLNGTYNQYFMVGCEILR